MAEPKMLTLAACPPGLFLFNGCLGFKSEYSTETRPGVSMPDAYVVESGEYFWGGTSDAAERSRLMVMPVASPLDRIAALEAASAAKDAEIDAAVEAEREACAALCDEIAADRERRGKECDSLGALITGLAARRIAQNIRSRVARAALEPPHG